MSNRTIGLIVFLILVTGGLIYLALQPAKPPAPPVVVKTTPTPAPQTTLAINPNSLVVSSPSGSLNVDIDTKQNNITGVQLELSFDPKVLTQIALKPGGFFPNPVILSKNIDYKNGRVTYILAIAPADEPIIGQGTVATIDFSGDFSLSPATKIDLLPKTLVTAKGASSSVLKEAVGATIIYKSTELPASPATRTAQ